MTLVPFSEYEVSLHPDRLVLLDPSEMHRQFRFSLRYGTDSVIGESYGVLSCRKIEIAIHKREEKPLVIPLAFTPPLYLEFDDFTIYRHVKMMESRLPEDYSDREGFYLGFLHALSEQISVTLLKTSRHATIYARFLGQCSAEHKLTFPQLHWVYGTQAVIHGS